jgi:single-strand DNA-binding protein
MAFFLVGKITKIEETNQVTEGFRKREFWVETTERTPVPVNFETCQGWCELLDDCKIGEKVHVEFTIRGRIHNNKCFNTLRAYKIAKV